MSSKCGWHLRLVVMCLQGRVLVCGYFLKYKSLQKIFLVSRANAIQQRLCDFSQEPTSEYFIRFLRIKASCLVFWLTWPLVFQYSSEWGCINIQGNENNFFSTSWARAHPAKKRPLINKQHAELQAFFAK